MVIIDLIILGNSGLVAQALSTSACCPPLGSAPDAKYASCVLAGGLKLPCRCAPVHFLPETWQFTRYVDLPKMKGMADELPENLQSESYAEWDVRNVYV